MKNLNFLPRRAKFSVGTLLLAGTLALMPAGRAAERVEYQDRLGLWEGEEFTAAMHYQLGNVTGLNDAGHAMGQATRFRHSPEIPFLEGGSAAWVAQVSPHTAPFTTIRVGLYGAGTEFSSTDGYEESETEWLSKGGYVIGNSTRYEGSFGINDNGQAVWVANAATGVTTRVGFFSEEFTRADTNYQESEAVIQSDDKWYAQDGYLIGSSTRYYNDAANGRYFENGEAAWVANAAKSTGPDSAITVRVGFYEGAEYSGLDGKQSSEAVKVTQNGFVIGNSDRYDTTTGFENGQAAWFVDASSEAPLTPVRLGFFADEYSQLHTGKQSSEAVGVTGNGYVIGNSTRYNNVTTGAENGQAAWFTDASQATPAMVRVGLFGEGYTGNDGYQFAEVVGVTGTGYVTGNARQFDADGDWNGQAAWVADNVATVGNANVKRIGLHADAEFTRADGYQSSEVEGVIESGYVVGSSTRYRDYSENGEAAWVANPQGATSRIGLYEGEEFTGSHNEQSSEVDADLLTQSGFVAGTSDRYDQFGADNGQAAWVADLTTAQTIRMGLLDTEHTGTDGHQYSEVQFLTEEGFVAGYSSRYDGSSQFGQTAWVFDLNTSTQYALDIFVDPATGYAQSEINGITSNGFVYGSYLDGWMERAFVWSSATGVIHLSDEVIGGLAAHGWGSLSTATFMNADGIVLGEGFLSNGSSQGVYAVAVVPEPHFAYALLVSLGCVLLIVRRRMRPAR